MLTAVRKVALLLGLALALGAIAAPVARASKGDGANHHRARAGQLPAVTGNHR